MKWRHWQGECRRRLDSGEYTADNNLFNICNVSTLHVMAYSRIPTGQGNQGIFEEFFQSAKTGSFQPKSGKKFSNQEIFFSKPFSNLLIWGNVF